MSDKVDALQDFIKAKDARIAELTGMLDTIRLVLKNKTEFNANEMSPEAIKELLAKGGE